MSYPKPLSQKTLDKMYKESGLSKEKIEFLGKLFDGAAALYGIITLKDLWNVYKEYAEKVPAIRLHRKDIIAFSSIARREEHDYYIYEIDELYKEETRTPDERFIIYREVLDLISKAVFYVLDETAYNKPFYVPENLLDLKGHLVTKEEEELVRFIEEIQSNSPVLEKRWNKNISKPSPYQGKKLKEIFDLSDSEQFELDWVSGKCEGGPKKMQEKKVKEFWLRRGGAVSDRIFRFLRISTLTGWITPGDLVSHITRTMEDYGVILSLEDGKKFVSLFMEFNNKSHLYTNRGWTPTELYKIQMKDYNGPIGLTFGPGIQKAIKEGNISLDELKARMKEMGIKVD